MRSFDDEGKTGATLNVVLGTFRSLFSQLSVLFKWDSSLGPAGFFLIIIRGPSLLKENELMLGSKFGKSFHLGNDKPAAFDEGITLPDFDKHYLECETWVEHKPRMKDSHSGKDVCEPPICKRFHISLSVSISHRLTTLPRNWINSVPVMSMRSTLPICLGRPGTHNNLDSGLERGQMRTMPKNFETCRKQASAEALL